MKKRKLTPDEMKMCIKSLAHLEQEKDWIDYQLSYYDLMLTTGLDMNHKKNVKDFKQKNNEFKSDLKMVKTNVKILRDQMRNGVEIREDKKEEK